MTYFRHAVYNIDKEQHGSFIMVIFTYINSALTGVSSRLPLAVGGVSLPLLDNFKATGQMGTRRAEIERSHRTNIKHDLKCFLKPPDSYHPTDN